MGSNKRCYIIWVIIIYLSTSSSSFALIDNRVTLDAYLHNYTHSVISKARTGVWHNVDLPKKFSGIEVSGVRLRSSTFWQRGARFDPRFTIPSRIIASPYVKRLEIMYENLGNWSSHYYDLPGYSFFAPVIGFMIYNASLTQYNSNELLNLTISGNDLIIINFTNILVPEFRKTYHNHHRVKCVNFQPNGHIELRKMVGSFVCSSQSEGHFSIVAPIVHHPPDLYSSPMQAHSSPRHRKLEIWKWWVVGFGAGLVVIFFLGVMGIFVCQMLLLRRTRLMERKAEKSVVLSTRWICESRMPLAYMTRTQATLEDDYAP